MRKDGGNLKRGTGIYRFMDEKREVTKKYCKDVEKRYKKLGR